MRHYAILFFSHLLLTPAYGSIIDQKKYDLEREVLSSLLKQSDETVDTKPCNLKNARVSDFISHFIILASLPEVEGRKKALALHCEPPESKLKYSDKYNCFLKAGEAIRLPNEPEGWERRLLFSFDYKLRKVVPKEFRCLDIP